MSEQTVSDILRKVQKIQFAASRRVNEQFAGQYHSVFRGQGIEFDEVREYQPGDDVRDIDWNVTARAGLPFVKRYCEERELTVVFVVDVSASGAFGSGRRRKLDLLIESAALLMFSALRNNDKVGLVRFCDRVLDYFPPRKGKSNALRLIRELVAIEPVARPTDLAGALEFVNRVQKRRGVVFLMSDFLCPTDRRLLAGTSRRHDLVAITVDDPREAELPDVGLVWFEDAETGRRVQIDSSSPLVRETYKRQWSAAREKLAQSFRRAGIDQLSLSTASDDVACIRRFFAMRSRRAGRRP